jgi:hypothetical protein
MKYGEMVRGNASIRNGAQQMTIRWKQIIAVPVLLLASCHFVGAVVLLAIVCYLYYYKFRSFPESVVELIKTGSEFRPTVDNVIEIEIRIVICLLLTIWSWKTLKPDLKYHWMQVRRYFKWSRALPDGGSTCDETRS